MKSKFKNLEEKMDKYDKGILIGTIFLLLVLLMTTIYHWSFAYIFGVFVGLSIGIVSTIIAIGNNYKW